MLSRGGLPNGCGDINIAVADGNNMRPITLMLIGPTVLPCLDISLMENGDGYIHIIDVNRCSLKIVRELLEEFQLNYVWEMQSCRLINPYKQGRSD